MSNEQAPTTATPVTAQPALPGAKPEQTPNAQATPAHPDKLGSQFAALDRRKVAAEQAEKRARETEQRAQTTLAKAQELEKMSAEEIVEWAAKQRNANPVDLVKAYVAKATGAPTADKLIEESKDPAVKALAEQLKRVEARNAELEKGIEAKTKAEQDAQARANVAAVKAECLSSASEVWSDDSDFPFFFESKAELSDGVYSYCARTVSKYVEDNGFHPEESDIQELIKSAPQLMLDELLKSPRGQRVVALKQPKLPDPPGRKPSLSPHRVTVSKQESDGDPPVLRTKVDRNKRLEDAKARLPDGVRFPGL